MPSTLPERAPRIPRSLALTYGEGSSSVKAYAEDISVGGLFINTESPLNQGDNFSLQLQLPGLTKPIQIQCQVAWSRESPNVPQERPMGMGVKFVHVPSEYEDILKPYIKTVEKLELKVSPRSKKDDQILKEYLRQVTMVGGAHHML